MKKKIWLSLLLVAAMLLTAIPVSVSAEKAKTVTMTELAGGAEISKGDTVTISNNSEFVQFANYVNEGGKTSQITFKVIAAFAFDKADGAATTASYPEVFVGTSENPFSGIFDGDGKEMSNFFLSNVAKTTAVKHSANADHLGLFAYTKDAEIKNVNLVAQDKATTATNVKSQSGLLVGEANNTKITKCTVSGITGTKALTAGGTTTGAMATEVGAIVGKATNGTVIDGCVSSINVKSGNKVGGIVGYAEGPLIVNCIANGNAAAQVTGEDYIFGSIVGEAGTGTKIVNCYGEGNVQGKSATTIAVCGGIVGHVAEGATVSNCFYAGNTTIIESNQGATPMGCIAGKNDGTVEYSYCEMAADRSIISPANIVGQGTATSCCFYQCVPVPETDPVEYEFILGEGETRKEIPCSVVNGSCPIEDATGLEHEPCHNTGFVDGTEYGYKSYLFKAYDGKTLTVGTKTGITTLDDALNAWIDELGDKTVNYAAWTVAGNTIKNCTHTTFTYVAYEGQEASCKGEGKTGTGDKYCAVCGKLMETNVTIPVPDHIAVVDKATDPTCVKAGLTEGSHCKVCGDTIVAQIDDVARPATGIHTAPEGTKACETYTCLVCEKLITDVEPHTAPEGTKACQDAKCTVCGADILHTEEHKAPDGTKSCQEYQCETCGTTIPATENHKAPDGTKPCQDYKCEVCGEDVKAAAAHKAGPNATCTADQICLTCGIVLQKALGHLWGDEPTCAVGQLCKLCGIENPDKPRDTWPAHTPNRDAPTCTEAVRCAVCNKMMQGSTGHKPGVEATCGIAQTCTVCHVIVTSATGEHNIDWTEATVVRAATAERAGILRATCEDCSATVEKSVYTTVRAESGYAKISGLTNIPKSADFIADKVAVADMKNVKVAEGYLRLQAMEIGAEIGGVSLSPDGEIEITFARNNSVVKMTDMTKLKIYMVDATGKAVELTVVSSDKYTITVKASSFGTILVAGDADEAVAKIGVKKKK